MRKALVAAIVSIIRGVVSTDEFSLKEFGYYFIYQFHAFDNEHDTRLARNVLRVYVTSVVEEWYIGVLQSIYIQLHDASIEVVLRSPRHELPIAVNEEALWLVFASSMDRLNVRHSPSCCERR